LKEAPSHCQKYCVKDVVTPLTTANVRAHIAAKQFFAIVAAEGTLLLAVESGFQQLKKCGKQW
jgi:hypothetical protein